MSPSKATTKLSPHRVADAIPAREHRYVQLVLRVEKAEARGTVRLVDKIAEDYSWKSAAWMLERRWPEEWGRRSLDIAVPADISKIREELHRARWPVRTTPHHRGPDRRHAPRRSAPPA
jgi:hypothetical protein